MTKPLPWKVDLPPVVTIAGISIPDYSGPLLDEYEFLNLVINAEKNYEGFKFYSRTTYVAFCVAFRLGMIDIADQLFEVMQSTDLIANGCMCDKLRNLVFNVLPNPLPPTLVNQLWNLFLPSSKQDAKGDSGNDLMPLSSIGDSSGTTQPIQDLAA